MKKILTLVFSAFIALSAMAQDNQDNEGGVSFNGGADITSSYVWRGQVLLKGANIQPYLDFNAGNFTLEFWNCTDFDGNMKEFDISALYTVGQVTFTVTDYFTQEDQNDPNFEPYKYGDYYAHTTGHALEFSTDWESDFGLDASMNVLFYGADKKDWEDDEDEALKNAYSTYFELGYTGNVKGVDIRPCIGMVFNRSTWYDATYNHTGINVVNIAVKASHDIKIGEKFKMPIYAAFGYNPMADDVAAFVGVQIGF